MAIIPDRISVSTTKQISVLSLISDSNHDGTIPKVIGYVGESIQEWTK